MWDSKLIFKNTGKKKQKQKNVDEDLLRISTDDSDNFSSSGLNSSNFNSSNKNTDILGTEKKHSSNPLERKFLSSDGPKPKFGSQKGKDNYFIRRPHTQLTPIFENPNTPSATQIIPRRSSNFIINADPSVYVPMLENPVVSKLTLEISIDDLNVNKLNAEVALELDEDRVSDLEESANNAEEKIENIRNSVDRLFSKSKSLSQAASVASEKLRILNEWCETIDSGDEGVIQAFLRFCAWLFTYLNLITQLVVGGLKKERQRKKPVKDE